MPTDEFGDKWACEPCIRGHRSTKCEHFDRFMMRVKRPGRPLSTCPHTKSQCNCGTEKVIMIRIPKASGCHCAPAPANPAARDLKAIDTTQPTEYQASPNPPLASPPVAVSSSPPKLDHEAIASVGSSQPVGFRSQIGPPTHISHSLQVKPMPVNLLPNSPMPDNQSGVILKDNLSPSQLSSEAQSQRFFGSSPESVRVMDQSTETTTNVDSDSTLALQEPKNSRPLPSNSAGNGQTLTERYWHTPKSNQKRCSCGQASEPTSRIVPGRPADSSVYSPNLHIRTGSLGHQPFSPLQSNAVLDPNKSSPLTHVPLSAQTPHIPYTTVYSMPATYATAENPLTQRQQDLFQQSGYIHSQQVPYYAPHGVMGSAAPSADGQTMSSLAHTCTCGPSCMCVFCVAHPYNAPTRDRVQTLAHLLPNDSEWGPRSPLQPSYGQPPHNFIDSSALVSPSGCVHSSQNSQQSGLPLPSVFSRPNVSAESYEGVSSASVSNTSYTAVPSSNYLTMQYEYDPFELGGCTDASGTCRCGDDCACVGCLTHSGHDGGGL